MTGIHPPYPQQHIIDRPGARNPHLEPAHRLQGRGPPLSVERDTLNSGWLLLVTSCILPGAGIETPEILYGFLLTGIDTGSNHD